MERFLRINDTYSLQYLISFEDIDPNYKLKITSAAAFVQDTVASFMTSRYIAAFDMIKENILWVVSDFTYLAGEKEAMWRDVVTSEIRITELSSFRIYYDYTLKTEDGSVIGTGTGIWVSVSAETGKPVPMTDFCEFREPADANPPVKHPKLKYISDYDTCMESSYPVTISELDFNKHMGNRSYLDFALRGMSEEFNESHKLNSYMIKFERQTYLGDTVTCKTCWSEKDRNTYLTKEYNTKGEEVCLIQTEWVDRVKRTEDFSTIVKR